MTDLADLTARLVFAAEAARAVFWIAAAIAAALACWALATHIHNRRQPAAADDPADDWGDHDNTPIVDTRPGPPGPALDTCRAIWPDAPTHPRKEDPNP